MSVQDQATQLASDVFNRIEREGLCQLHIIEDELRCRLPLTGSPDTQPAPDDTGTRPRTCV